MATTSAAGLPFPSPAPPPPEGFAHYALTPRNSTPRRESARPCRAHRYRTSLFSQVRRAGSTDEEREADVICLSESSAGKPVERARCSVRARSRGLSASTSRSRRRWEPGAGRQNRLQHSASLEHVAPVGRQDWASAGVGATMDVTSGSATALPVPSCLRRSRRVTRACAGARQELGAPELPERVAHHSLTLSRALVSPERGRDASVSPRPVPSQPRPPAHLVQAVGPPTRQVVDQELTPQGLHDQIRSSSPSVVPNVRHPHPPSGPSD